MFIESWTFGSSKTKRVINVVISLCKSVETVVYRGLSNSLVFVFRKQKPAIRW